jgi:hypothetical protein
VTKSHPSSYNLTTGFQGRAGLKKLLLWISVNIFFLVMTGVSFSGDVTVLSVAATVISKSNCKFSTATATLAFGNLNPANSSNVIQSTTINFVCRGSAPNATFLMSQDYGLYETFPGENKMRNSAVLTEFLPYTLTFNPSTATVPKNSTQTLTVTGTVLASDYQKAYVGNYVDTVVISLNP